MSKILSYSNSLTANNSTLPSDNNKLQVSPSMKLNTKTQSSIAFLQREIMLLRNELNFVLYLKQQHLGRLHILDSTVEAERQNLYDTCKILKSQLSQAQAVYDRQRKENASIKRNHVQ